MATDTYEVIADEVTIHKQVGELRDPITNTVIGIQQGLGQTYLKGAVIPVSDISPIVLEALENEDHPSHEAVSRKIRKSGEPVQGSPSLVPFAGYEDMDEQSVVSVMANLPSATIARIKEWEAAHENREGIVAYNVGTGESSVARQTGKVGSKRQPADDSKAVSNIRTREVVDDDVVPPGEGVTGTGEPKIPHGTAAAEAEDDSDGDGTPKKKVVRRGRRDRASGSKASSSSSNDS